MDVRNQKGEGVTCVIWTRGGSFALTIQEWWNFDINRLYRENGPAVELANGAKAWYSCGKLHRLDGPALIFHDGEEEWYIHGILIRDNVRKWVDEEQIDLKTEEGQMAFILRWT